MDKMITSEIETEAAIYAEGTKFTKSDIIAEYRAHVRRAAEDGVEHLDIQRFCKQVLCIGQGDTMPAYTDQPQYRIAFTMESGEWDVVETFHAANNAAANEYAEENYADRDWYVLDAAGNNINCRS
jgi:hypothetical protein